MLTPPVVLLIQLVSCLRNILFLHRWLAELALSLKREKAGIPETHLYASASEMVLSEPRSDTFREQINNNPDIPVSLQVPWRCPAVSDALDYITNNSQ